MPIVTLIAFLLFILVPWWWAVHRYATKLGAATCLRMLDRYMRLYKFMFWGGQLLALVAGAFTLPAGLAIAGLQALVVSLGSALLVAMTGAGTIAVVAWNLDRTAANPQGRVHDVSISNEDQQTMLQWIKQTTVLQRIAFYLRGNRVKEMDAWLRTRSEPNQV